MLKKALLAALPLAVVAALGFGSAAYADEPAADVAEPEVATQEVAADVADVADEPAADVAAQAQNGWSNEDGSWYYYVNGVQAKGWKQINGTWYFFDLDYAEMATGYWCTSSAIWSEQGTFHMFAANGAWVNKTGWYYNDVDEGWAYLESGKCASYGWKQINGKWYFFDDCAMITGELHYNDSWYYLNDKGAMVTGWFSLEGGYWLYADASGKVVENGWKQINGKWYYFDEFEMLSNDFIETADGSYCYVGENGAMATGWFKWDGSWLYAQANGKIVENGWFQVGTKWYYFYDFRMVQDDVIPASDGSYCYVGDDGAMVTGWIQWPDGSWSYAEASGKIVESGWKQINGKWYYFENGEMAQDYWLEANEGEWYYLDESGAMVANTWLKTVDGEYVYWYYQMANGKSAMGWYKVDGYWYYFIPESDGEMAANITMLIDGVNYRFDEHGKWTKIAG